MCLGRAGAIVARGAAPSLFQSLPTFLSLEISLKPFVLASPLTFLQPFAF